MWRKFKKLSIGVTVSGLTLHCHLIIFNVIYFSCKYGFCNDVQYSGIALEDCDPSFFLF